MTSLGRTLRATLCGALLNTGVASASVAAHCPENQVFYKQECRPASVCEPGCFPQAIACRERSVLGLYDLPWAKFMDVEHQSVPMYDKRLDLEGLDQQHLAYIPDLNVTIGTHLTPKWKGLYWDIALFIDEGSDKKLNRVYRFELSVVGAISLFYKKLPAIIKAAQDERDQLSYLYGSFAQFGEGVEKEVTDQYRVEYAGMLSELERQMCVPSGW